MLFILHLLGILVLQKSSKALLYVLLEEESEHRPNLHYGFLAAPPLSLHPLAFLISSCSKLPLGAQGKSRRLSLVLALGINKKQWMQEVFSAQELHRVLLSSFHLVQLNALQHH